MNQTKKKDENVGKQAKKRFTRLAAGLIAFGILCGPMMDTTAYASDDDGGEWWDGNMVERTEPNDNWWKEEETTTSKAKKASGSSSSQKSTGDSELVDLMNSWKEVNSDVMGYLRVPGTNIDYPVVKGATNETYMNLDIYKNYSRNGVIWADQDVTSKSKNTILYGHNWTNFTSNPRIGDPNDVMFAQLTAFQHESFAKEHPTIQYANANGSNTWVIFAAAYTTDLNFYIDANASPTSLAQKAKSLSLHDYDVDVKSSDTILTLSTCTRYFGQFENQRFIVMARKLRDGEKVPSSTIA